MFLQNGRASINDNNHILHTMQEADSEKMLKGVQSVVTELYTVSVVFYVIGLMDYSACSNITGNTACNNYRQFMLANLIISHIIFCIPEEICQPAMSILKAVIGFVFTLCHAAFLGMAMNPDSKCPDEISAGCDAQAFKGYNILHYYSLIYLGTLAVALGLVVIFSICSCAIHGAANINIIATLNNPIGNITTQNTNQHTNTTEDYGNPAGVRIVSNSNRDR